MVTVKEYPCLATYNSTDSTSNYPKPPIPKPINPIEPLQDPVKEP